MFNKKKIIERERNYWDNVVGANSESVYLGRSSFYIHDLAMTAMSGCLANGDNRTPEVLAKYCYDVAEIMINEAKTRDKHFTDKSVI